LKGCEHLSEINVQAERVRRFWIDLGNLIRKVFGLQNMDESPIRKIKEALLNQAEAEESQRVVAKVEETYQFSNNCHLSLL
jgi:hypothetical protein